MKEFFYNLLQQLDKLTGIKQYDKLMALPETESDKEIEDLLKILCNVSAQFPLIPKDAQKSIIRQAVVADGDFIGLNAKFVYKSLNAQRDRFFKESHHVKEYPGPDWKPVEGEDRQKWLKAWEQELAKFGQPETQSHVKAVEQSLPQKPTGIYAPSSPPEHIEMARLRQEYARECTDLYTGKVLEGKPEFSEWLKQKGV
jgi:hypothetical protein